MMNDLAGFLNELFAGKLKPNHVTLISLFLHLFVALAIYNGQLKQAAIMLVAFGLLDAVDGALARIQKTVSNTGILLDATADRIKEILIYAALGYWLAINEGANYAIFAIIALGGSFMVTYIKTKGEAVLSKSDRSLSATQLNRIFSRGVMRFEIRMFLIVLALITGEVLVFIAFIGLFAWFSAFSQFATVIEQLDKD